MLINFTFRYIWLVCFFLLVGNVVAVATHIVGGELNYRYQGNNVYDIQLTVYRDCFNGQAQFDDPASIGIFNSSNALVASALVNISSQQIVPNAINTPCLIPPSNVCYEVAIYSFATILPPVAGGYQLVYQRCCRNSTIINLANVNSTGATYIATIPDPAVASVNSNPVFNNWPPTFVCEDAPFTFDHSAFDYDGDSLVYELCLPLRGASPSDPAPQPPNNPPYQPVTFQPPFSLTNLMGGTAMTIDRNTGLLKATPNQGGQYVYGVCVKEFRNGVYLGETRRDFQVNVVPCPMITVASIFSPTIVCGSLTAEFTNNSYNAATYRWNFGDPTTTADTSSSPSPAWTYPDTGVYVTTLIAYSGIDSLCNDTVTGIVKVYPVFNADFSIVNNHCSPYFEFRDQSYGIGGVADFWSWNFGDNQTASIANPAHTYTLPGNYEVILIASTDSACLDTIRRVVSVLQNPIAGFNTGLDTCAYTLELSNTSLFANNYYWNFGDSNADTLRHPVHHYQQSGSYTVQLLAVTDSGCTDNKVINLTIPPLPEARFTYSVPPCDSLVSFSNLSDNAISYRWNFGDGDVSVDPAPIHVYEKAGSIPVELIAVSPYGCLDTIINEIFFISYKEAGFNMRMDTCSGLLHFEDVTRNAVLYHWDFGDGDSSSLMHPVKSYTLNGEYTITLTVNNESACVDRIAKTNYYESPLGELLFIPNAFTPNADGLNDNFIISLFRPCDVYGLIIYNRWGQKVFETDDAASSFWDGSFEGGPAEEGVYVYLLRGSEMSKTGVLSLIR